MANNLTPEQKRDRLAAIIKWAVALIFLAAISPVIFFSIKGMVGLIAAFAVGQVAIQLAPVA